MYSYSNIIAKKEDKNSFVVDATGALIAAGTAARSTVVTVPAPSAAGERATAPPTAHAEAADAQQPPMVAFEVPGVNVFVVDNFLTDEECDAIIAESMKVGFTFWAEQPHESNEEATASNPLCREEASSREGAAQFRTAETIEGTFPSLSDALWARMRPCFEASGRGAATYSPAMEGADELFERDIEGTWGAKELSKNLLIAHYPEGGHFAPHVDGTTIEDFNCRSLFTVLIYLNDVTEGGGTHIYGCEQHEVLTTCPRTGRVSGSGENVLFTVQALKGRLAVFYHNVVHEGVAVGAGLEKFIIRGDVMYSRTPALGSERDLEAFALYTQARELESNGQAMEAVRLFQRVRKMSPLLADIYQL